MSSSIVLALLLLTASVRNAEAHDCSSAEDCAAVVENSSWLSAALAAFLAYIAAKKPKKKEEKEEDEPFISVSPEETLACPRQDVTFVATFGPPDSVVTWQSSEAQPSAATGDTFITRFNSSGDHTVVATVTTPGGRTKMASARSHIHRNSGASWAADVPGSASMTELVEPFRGNLQRFISALTSAGIDVSVRETYRPLARCYLMHYSWRISRPTSNGHFIDPRQVPGFPGLDICWLHRDENGLYDESESRAGAAALVAALKLTARSPFRLPLIRDMPIGLLRTCGSPGPAMFR